MRPIDADKLVDAMTGACNIFDAHGVDTTIARTLITVAAKAPTIGGWISVKDKLPERYERILTYDKYSGVKENWLLQSSPCVSWSYGFHVTHWMPLPEPPKEDEHGT